MNTSRTPPVKNNIAPSLHSVSRSIARQLPSGFVSPFETKAEAAAKKSRPVCGPFRATMNAGDTLGRKYLQCDCPNPLSSQSGKIGDHVSQRGCNVVINGYSTKRAPVANCNTKYVYDSSDYIKYKKLNTQRKNYNADKYARQKPSGGYIMRALQRVR